MNVVSYVRKVIKHVSPFGVGSQTPDLGEGFECTVWNCAAQFDVVLCCCRKRTGDDVCEIG